MNLHNNKFYLKLNVILFFQKCKDIIIFRFQYKCSHFVYVFHRLSRLDCSLHTSASLQLKKESCFNYIQHLQTKHMLSVSRFYRFSPPPNLSLSFLVIPEDNFNNCCWWVFVFRFSKPIRNIFHFEGDIHFKGFNQFEQALHLH